MVTLPITSRSAKMLYSNLPQPTDEETDLYLASLMIKEYGDLLKISRSRSVGMPLPTLRKYISENDLIGILEKTHNLLNTSEVNSVDEFKELYK